MVSSLRPPLRMLFALSFLLLVPAGVGAKEGESKDPGPGVPDAEFQARINEAIERGARWLRQQQETNGSLGGLYVRGTQHYEMGATALGGLALLAAGDQRGDAVVDKIYAFLKTKDEMLGQAGVRSTYDAGVLLMFIAAYWRGQEQHFSGSTRPGRKSKNPCNMPPEVLKWVQDIVNWLVRVRKGPTSTWGYPAHRDDLSNSQYAYLGLRAARDCGARIPPQVFLQGVKTMLERQQEDGPKVARLLPGPDPDSEPYAIQAGDRARGWSYLVEPFTPSGSMTTSGIGVLAICHDALTRPKRISAYKSSMENAVRQGVQDGFSWLDKFWTVTRNPGPASSNWHYYYLYGLERAAVLGGRDLIGMHDWYLEGARTLVSQQQAEGKWSTGVLGDDTYAASDLVDTEWAILFLARATRPAPPLQAPVVTGGD